MGRAVGLLLGAVMQNSHITGLGYSVGSTVAPGDVCLDSWMPSMPWVGTSAVFGWQGKLF